MTSGEHFTVGRDSDCNLTFEEWMIPSETGLTYDQTSRLHFIIYRQNDKTRLLSKSGNGTYVNGERLYKDDERILRNGARIGVLSNEIELFWYIDETASLLENTYPIPIIRRYLVGNVVGEGTFGTVRKGFSKQSLQPVALKFVNKAKLKFAYQLSEEDEAKMMTEVEILTKLDHPCVTGLTEYLNTRDLLVIVMEFAEGGELEKQIQLDKTMSRLSESTAKFQFYQICHAVAYFHSKNVCHRDLKLSNILMSQPEPECILKISDFGVSKIWTAENILRTKIGTPLFMAPEVNFAGASGAEYSCKADCWALGIILYQLLSGNLPHDSQGATSGPGWDHISDMAKDLISKLLKVNPEERPDAAAILHHNWFLSDPFVCNKSRNVMFQLENSVRHSDDSVRQSESSMMSMRGIVTNQCRDPACTACLEVNFHNTNINSSTDVSNNMAVSDNDGVNAEEMSTDKVPVEQVSDQPEPMSKESSCQSEAVSSSQGDSSASASEDKVITKETTTNDDEYNIADAEDVCEHFDGTNHDNKLEESLDNIAVVPEPFKPVDKQDNVVEDNFDNIKSRLRPRTSHIDYYKVNIIQPEVSQSPAKLPTKSPGKRKNFDTKQGCVLTLNPRFLFWQNISINQV